MRIISPLGDGAMALKAAVSNDWASVDSLRNHVCLFESLVRPALHRFSLLVERAAGRRILLHRGRLQDLDHGVRHFVAAHAVNYLLGNLKVDSPLLHRGNHLLLGALAIEHVEDVARAEWSALLSNIFRLSKVVYEMRQRLI